MEGPGYGFNGKNADRALDEMLTFIEPHRSKQ
jgi:hypothetical protein